MGNFLSADLSEIPEGLKVWHLILILFAIVYVLPPILRFPLWLFKNI